MLEHNLVIPYKAHVLYRIYSSWLAYKQECILRVIAVFEWIW